MDEQKLIFTTRSPADPGAPMSAADPRPDGKPYYIDDKCPKCDGSLELQDVVYEDHASSNPAEPWHDEWCCPNCGDGLLYMDWPAAKYEEMNEAIEEEAMP